MLLGKVAESVALPALQYAQINSLPGTVWQIVACQGSGVAIEPVFPDERQAVVCQQCQEMGIEVAAKFLRRFFWQYRRQMVDGLQIDIAAGSGDLDEG